MARPKRPTRPQAYSDYIGPIGAMEDILFVLSLCSYEDRKKIVDVLANMKGNGSLLWVTGGIFTAPKKPKDANA